MAAGRRSLQANILHDDDGNVIGAVLDGVLYRLAVDANITGILNVVTGSAPTFATVGVASAVALAANASRVGVILTVTTSGRRISLGLNGNAAVLNSGITVPALTPVFLDPQMITQGAVAAIADQAATNLAIQEFTA